MHFCIQNFEIPHKASYVCIFLLSRFHYEMTQVKLLQKNEMKNILLDSYSLIFQCSRIELKIVNPF